MNKFRPTQGPPSPLPWWWKENFFSYLDFVSAILEVRKRNPSDCSLYFILFFSINLAVIFDLSNYAIELYEDFFELKWEK